MSKFQMEAAAEVVLHNEPPGTPWYPVVVSHYQGESLMQSVSLIINAISDRPAADTLFIMDGFNNLVSCPRGYRGPLGVMPWSRIPSIGMLC